MAIVMTGFDIPMARQMIVVDLLTLDRPLEDTQISRLLGLRHLIRLRHWWLLLPSPSIASLRHCLSSKPRLLGLRLKFPVEPLPLPLLQLQPW